MRPQHRERLRRYFGWPLGIGLSVLCVISVGGQGVGIRPVTASDVSQAIALGDGDGGIGQMPLLTRLIALRDAQEPTPYPGPKDFDEMRRFLHSSPFIFYIESPFTRIASGVRGWRGSANPPAPLTGERANQDLVGIDVRPGPDLSTADEVKDVFVRRGATVWKPLRATRETTTMRSGGREKVFRCGTFTFPFEVFEPSSDITVVVVGAKGNFEWTIVRDELAAMK